MKASNSVQQKQSNLVKRLTKQGLETTTYGNVIEVENTSLKLLVREDCVQANYLFSVALFDYDSRLIVNIKRELKRDLREQVDYLGMNKGNMFLQLCLQAQLESLNT